MIRMMYSFIIVWVNLIVTASIEKEIDSTDIGDYTSKLVSNMSRSVAKKPSYLTRITHLNRGDFVFYHNVIRSSTVPVATNMVFMVWALRLEKLADDAVSDCVFKDSLNDNDHRKLQMWYSSDGMNAWHGPASVTLNVTEVVGFWSQEKAFFDYAELGCELGRKCMSYAQVVWATTSHVGCSLKFCKIFIDQGLNQRTDQHYVVCVYGEGGTKLDYKGNYKFPYKSGNQSCTDCPAGFSACRTNLCDTKPSCETVVDCPKVGNMQLCLCEEKVYSRGERSKIVALWMVLEAVVIFISSSGYGLG